MIDIHKPQTEIDELATRYRTKYGYAALEVKVLPSPSSIIVEGWVLVESQKQDILSTLQGKDYGAVHDSIRVLADPETQAPLGWGTAGSIPLNMWRECPGHHSGDPEMASQVIGKIPFRILIEEQGYFLIQTEDLALGWADKEQVDILPRSSESYWHNITLARPDSVINASGKLESVITSARSYLGTKYLWGGKTNRGVDCSGLMQVVYTEGAQITLPRNSRDQRKTGMRIEKSEIQPGDLIFFSLLNGAGSHVGLCVSLEDELRVIHACRRLNEVIEQPLAAMEHDYIYRTTERIARF